MINMKVLIIAQYFPPDMGGASARAFNVALGLLKKGCVVKVVSAFPHYPHGKIPAIYRRKALKPEKLKGLDLVRVWVPALPHNSVVNRVILHLCFIVSSLFALPFVGSVDVIWAANPNLFSFFSALVYGSFYTKPIIRNVDDLWPEVFYELGLVKSRLFRWLLDFLAGVSYKVSVAITPISSTYKTRIVKKYSVRPEKLQVIEVGVNEAYEPPKREQARRDKFVVMYSGILGVSYDFETVLKAAKLLSNHEDIVFVIRGIGELEHEIYRLVKELKLDNIVISTAFLSKPKLKSVLSSANVFLLPMKETFLAVEGLPTKVFEYQSFGKPIVCCSEGESAMYVEATRSGLVVKPGDAAAVAQAVLRLYRDRKLAWELGWNGWKHVSENLTSERIGDRMYEVFLSIRNDRGL
ncbi:glycosyltransferase family 4 protein [Candidatus Bathyarchaeota archaeon]|nr:glycosyltransferase family 4 protein [Candidatus Bathyarchaeota archaeon]